jgi:hypothetical protein
MRLRPWQILLVASAAFAVEIVPPSPYMSSPPPAQADTTVIDAGRKPRTATVEPGVTEVWYPDWNLASDRPVGTETVEAKAPMRNHKTFRVAYNDHGWPSEISYFDAKGEMRWTKLFRYPAKIPSGPGDVPFTSIWISAKAGGTINMTKLAEAYKGATWHVKQRKYQVSDLLGEPLVVDSRDGGLSGSAETWVYLIDGKEVRFNFDKDNALVELPGTEAPAPVVAPKTETVKPSVDSAKAKPAAAPAKGKKK